MASSVTPRSPEAVAAHWQERLGAFLPGFLAAHPVLAELHGAAAVAMHGSTTLGVDDAHSDLDVWLLLGEPALRALDARSPTRFFGFELDGKPGHCNAESLPGFTRRAAACDMPLLTELRSARILRDPDGAAGDLLETARRPMPSAVREAWFRFHYVQMRQAHRAADGPANRGDPIPLLQFAADTVGHALRAALVLDGEPYPYDKWLAAAARRTPTGTAIEERVRALLDLFAQDALRQPGPEREHPIRPVFLDIRKQLIDSARKRGIDGPWLDEWWLSLDAARAGIARVRWS